MDTVYQVSPGIAVSGGAAYKRDTLRFTENDVTSGFVELSYSNEHVLSFIKGRVVEVKYLSEVNLPAGIPAATLPFLRNARLNAQRRDLTAGVLVGHQRVLSVYGEASAGTIDYFNPANEAQLDRDAKDYYAIAGLRITLAPSLVADIGYRYNHRDLDDRAVSSYTSGYFDGSLSWGLAPNLLLRAEVDRVIGEPSSSFGRLSDIRRYTASINFKPSLRSLLQLQFSEQRIRDVGATLTFRERSVAGEYSYTLSNAVELYAGVQALHEKEETSETKYNRFKVGVGTRVKLGVDGEFLTRDLSDTRLPIAGTHIELSAGYSHLELPKMQMIRVVGGGFFDTVIGKVDDNDGDVNGMRYDVRWNNVTRLGIPGRMLAANINFKGFYANYHGTDKSACDFTATVNCAFVNIVDTNPYQENNTGPFGRLRSRTKRNVDYWGIAIEADLERGTMGGSLKDSYPVYTPSPFKFGLGMRALQQRNELFAIDISVPDPVDYQETLNTYYWGGFVGFEKEHDIGRGFTLSVDTHAGLYYARSDYDGKYVAFYPAGGVIILVDQGQQRQINDDSLAFIGGAKIAIDKDLGWGKFGVFAQGEYVSYAPRVKYNDSDEAGGAPFGIIGSNRGTSLGDDDMYSYTVGARLSVPLN